MASISSPSFYDPYNQISYLELNKHRYGQIERDESEKLENRTRRPSAKKFYLKRNGDSSNKKPKLFVWKKWASPTLTELIEEAGSFMGIGENARILYDKNGRRIRDEGEIRDRDTYFIANDEEFEKNYGPIRSPSPRPAPSRTSYTQNRPHKSAYRSARRESKVKPSTSRRASWWSTASEDLIDYDYDKYDYGPTTPRRSRSTHSIYDTQYYDDVPRPYSFEGRSLYRGATSADYRPSSTYQHYDYSATPRKAYPKNERQSKSPGPSRMKSTKKYKSAKRDSRKGMANRHTYAGREYSPRARSTSRRRDVRSANHVEDFISDFDHDDAMRKDKEALHKHKEMMSTWKRSKSAIIYNRRDQTHPDAYIIYVFLNGQGMTSQHVNFQRKQLEKGMNYVLEIVARRFNVNPAKLCDMDGKKIAQVQDLMSRGAYVLVPMGQKFRDQWYFLPDNAIDTSSNVDKVRERSAQRDRLMQRREKRETVRQKTTQKGRTPYDFTRSKSTDYKPVKRKSIYY